MKTERGQNTYLKKNIMLRICVLWVAVFSLYFKKLVVDRNSLEFRSITTKSNCNEQPLNYMCVLIICGVYVRSSREL